jgi:hypothetical protein
MQRRFYIASEILGSAWYCHAALTHRTAFCSGDFTSMRFKLAACARPQSRAQGRGGLLIWTALGLALPSSREAATARGQLPGDEGTVRRLTDQLADCPYDAPPKRGFFTPSLPFRRASDPKNLLHAGWKVQPPSLRGGRRGVGTDRQAGGSPPVGAAEPRRALP